MINIEINKPPTPRPAPPSAGKFSPLWLAYGAGGLMGLAILAFAVVQLTRSAPRKPAAIVEAPAEETLPPEPDASPATSVNPTFDANPTPEPPSANPVADIPLFTPQPTPPPEPEQPPAEPVPKKPESPKPPPAAPKSTTPAKPLKPFEGFAVAIDLPPPMELKETKLGPAKMPDDYECLVHLIGGDVAARTKHEFDCVAAAVKDGEPTRAWNLEVQNPGSSKNREILATLAVRNQQLLFRWEEKAAEHPAATGLRNCALRLSAGQGTHTVALRKMVKAAAMPISYEKKTESWALPDGPRPSKVQVEFDVVSPREMPRPRFLGSSTVAAAGGEVYIEFGLKEAEKFLKLQVETRLDSDSLDVTVTPWVQVTGQPKPVALTDANLKKLQETVTQTSLAVDKQLSAMPKTKTPARDALQKQLSACRQAESQLAKLKSLEKDFSKQARLTARVYLPAENILIELVTAK